MLSYDCTHILVMVDRFSQWPVTVPLPDLRTQTILNAHHWRFIDGHRKAQKSRDIVYNESMIAGQTPECKCRRYWDASKRIFNLLNQFNGNASMPPQTMWEFLRGVAHNFCMD